MSKESKPVEDNLIVQKHKGGVYFCVNVFRHIKGIIHRWLFVKSITHRTASVLLALSFMLGISCAIKTYATKAGSELRVFTGVVMLITLVLLALLAALRFLDMFQAWKVCRDQHSNCPYFRDLCHKACYPSSKSKGLDLNPHCKCAFGGCPRIPLFPKF
jgi:hypothetical protein